MRSGRLLSISLLLAIGISVLISIPVLADTEPNDSLLAPEVLGEGTFTGTVNITTAGDDVDFYRISVPADKDIEVTITKLDNGTGSIKVSSYDHNQIYNYFGGIDLMVTSGGETDIDSDYNSMDVPQNIYLKVEGQGEYRLTIKFTTETADAFKALGSACLIMMIITILVIVVGVGLLIFFIIFFKKKDKNKKAEGGSVQITSNILRSDVVDVPPPQQQYQQTPPPQQQQVRQQYQQPQQPAQQPAYPPMGVPRQVPSSPPGQQPQQQVQYQMPRQ